MINHLATLFERRAKSPCAALLMKVKIGVRSRLACCASSALILSECTNSSQTD